MSFSLCLSKLNKYDECIELLSKYLFENPDNAEYRLALYQVYKEIGEHKKAFEYFVGMYDYSTLNSQISNLLEKRMKFQLIFLKELLQRMSKMVLL